MARGRWPGLDGLRGIAVLAVVLFHLGYAPSGFLGVDVFFVLSGFLITSLVMAEYRAKGDVRLLRFYARRTLRLFPALVGMVIVVLAIALVTRRAVGDNIHDGVAALLYVGNLTTLHGLFDHTWTLALEEQFYLVWPALLLLALTRRGVASKLPAVGLVAVILIADLVTGRDGTLHTYVRAMGLPLGCWLALAGPRVQRQIGVAGPIALCLVLVSFFFHLPGWLTTGWPVGAGAVLSVPVVALLVHHRVGIMESVALRWMGLRSYSLYLWHFPLTSLALHHLPASVPHLGRVALAAAASLIAADASYRFVETPVLRWRDRSAVPEPVPIAA